MKHKKEKSTNIGSPLPSIMLFSGVILMIFGLLVIIHAFSTPYTEVSLSQVPPNSTIIDIRNSSSYSVSHIEGAINIPYYSCSGCFLNSLKKYTNDSMIFLYGERSVEVAVELSKHGFINIHIITNWESNLT